MTSSVIIGTGSYLPRKIVTNADLEGIVDTTDEWISTRTGIKTRHIAGAGEDTSMIAAAASRSALQMAGLSPKDITMIIVATISSEMTMPSCACLVQKELGATNAFAFDLNAACSGFLYGLDCAYTYLEKDPSHKILVIGAENLSGRIDWKDRNTCVIFGDGAGACVVSGTNDRPTSGLLRSKLQSDGTLHDLLNMPCAPGTNPDLKNFNNKASVINMSGRDVFKYAVRAMAESIKDILQQENININDIKLLIPHQANIRILKSLSERLKIAEEKLYINIDKYGNTSAATIPIALDEANRDGMLKEGDLLLLCAFGGGFTWGSAIIRW